MAGKSENRSWKLFVFCAVFVAMSIVLTRFFSINIGTSLRIGLGRLPVMLASILYGPLAGLAVGAAADILGAVMTTGWDPILTLPAALCGLLPYIFVTLFRVGKGGLGSKQSLKYIPGILFTVLLTKVITQGVLMTVLLADLYYGFESFWFLFLMRNIITVSEGLIETAIIYVLYTNKAVYKAACGGVYRLA